MGDKQIAFYAQSVNQYRTTAFTYLNSEGRIQYALQGFMQDTFYYGNNPALYDPSLAPYIDRDDAKAVAEPEGRDGVRDLSVQPLLTDGDLRRVHVHVARSTTNPSSSSSRIIYQLDQYGNPVFRQRPHDAGRRRVRAGDDDLP